jgi:predicted nicotinamide N-methyase
VGPLAALDPADALTSPEDSVNVGPASIVTIETLVGACAECGLLAVRQNGRVPRDPAVFVRDHVHPKPVAFVPELVLHQADDPIGLWELGEGEYHSEQPPPFWAFAWAGGQAMSRYVLDHPELVVGRRVLDLASGSGLVAIAAARAGAAHVRAVDIDPLAMAAIELNASANGVVVTAELADILDAGRADADVVLAGDVFYSAAMAARVYGFLRRAARDGARVLVGDPDRAFLPRGKLRLLATMDVPVPYALESTDVKPTSIWEVPPSPDAGAAARSAVRRPEPAARSSTGRPPDPAGPIAR